MAILESLEALGSLFFALLLINIFFATFFIWVGMKISGIKNIKFKKILLAAATISFIINIMGLIFSILPILNTLLGFFVGIVLSLFLLKSLFRLAYKEILVVWMFNVMAQIFAVILGAYLFIGGIEDFFKII
jgi:hypothetical protein